MDIKERIKQKADELFRRYGIKSVTMDDIAEQLGVSKKTIYQTFSDKSELVDDVIVSIITENQFCCKRDKAQASNAIEEVYLAMRMMRAMFENMNPAIVLDIERHHPLTYQKFQKHKFDFLFRIVKENIERGKKEELYRPEIDPEVMAVIRLETMMMPFNETLFPKNKYTLLYLQQQLIEYYLFGLVSKKGYKLVLKYQDEGFLKEGRI